MSNGTPERISNIALLIDADNASPASLDPVLTVLAELGSVNIRRVYGNWSKPALRRWSELSHRYALDPQQQFDVTKGKNATDMKMTIDAMDLLFGGRVGGFGIMSSDSDFAPLVTRLRNDGLPVYGFGADKTPISFKQACTRFIDVGALVAAPDAAADDAEAAPSTLISSSSTWRLGGGGAASGASCSSLWASAPTSMKRLHACWKETGACDVPKP